MPDTLWIDKPNGIFRYYPNPDSLAQLAFQEHEVFTGVLTRSLLYMPNNSFTVTFGLDSNLL